MILRFCSNADPAFMVTQMTYGELSSRIKSVAVGTTSVAAVYWRDVASLEVRLPDMEFQQSFARMLTSIEALISESVSHRSKMISFRTALMEDLLTGRVRV